jgi:hypothetical protein
MRGRSISSRCSAVLTLSGSDAPLHGVGCQNERPNSHEGNATAAPLDAAVDVRMTSRHTDAALPPDQAIRYRADLAFARPLPSPPPQSSALHPRPCTSVSESVLSLLLFSTPCSLLPARSRSPLCIWPRHKHL